MNGLCRRGALQKEPFRGRIAAFTLIELLTATAVLCLILAVLFAVIGQTSGIVRHSTARIEAFQSARIGYDLMTRSLSQATLNTYLDYGYDEGTNKPPTRYLRKSELGFIVGLAGGPGTTPDGSTDTLPGTLNTGQAIFFQGPLDYVTNTAAYSGMESLLNACGYYIAFTNSSPLPPHVSSDSNPYRYRLMQFLAPSEANTVYKDNVGNKWFSAADLQARYVMPVADNVIALVIRPQDPERTPADLTSDYAYDSRLDVLANPQPFYANQLPPNINVTMVAIDEDSARRLDEGSSQPAKIAEALKGKFRTISEYETDLDNLAKALTDSGVKYKIFNSSVPLRESKWTK